MKSEFYVNERGNWATRNIKYLRPARWFVLFAAIYIFFGLIQLWNLNIATKTAEAQTAQMSIRLANIKHSN